MKESIRDTTENILKDIIGVLCKDPVSAYDLWQDLKLAPATIKDTMYMERLSAFLLHAKPENVREKHDEKLKSFVEVLAENSPNEEAGYEGDLEKLYEYAERIIKVIDDCGTKKKAVYIANLTRAVYARKINTAKYFKLAHCVVTLIEEDLLQIKKIITKDVIDSDDEYIEDYRSLGLMRECAGGYLFTKRAFELVKYALDYEGNLQIPNDFPSRITPGAISEEEYRMIEKSLRD